MRGLVTILAAILGAYFYGFPGLIVGGIIGYVLEEKGIFTL